MHLPLPAERQGPRLVDVSPAHRVPHQRYPFRGRYLRPARGTLEDTTEKLPHQPHQQHHDEKPDEPAKHHLSRRHAPGPPASGLSGPLVACIGPLGMCGTEAFDRVGGGERFGAARGAPLDLFPGLDGTLEILFPESPDDAEVQDRLGVRRGHVQ